MGKDIYATMTTMKNYHKEGFLFINHLNFRKMKKKIEVKLELNKKTIAKLDSKAMKQIKGGSAGLLGTDRNSNGTTNCSSICCASVLA
jgi:hypothetical protein